MFAIIRVFRNVQSIRNDGRVAQSVEQRIENPRVTGSIPVPATNKIAHLSGLFYVYYF